MDEEPTPRSAIIPILVIIIILLVAVLAFQAGRNQTPQPVGDAPSPQRNAAPEIVADETGTPEYEFDNEPEPTVVKAGEVVERETLQSRGVRLVEPAVVAEEDESRVKKSVEQRMVYDSLLRWTMYGKVEDKKWAVRALINMSYAAEARIVRTVEKNDGKEIVVLYDFAAINTIEVLSDVEAVKLDFMKDARPYMSVGAGAAAMWLAPLFDVMLPGSGTAVKIAGTAFPLATEVVSENLALRGYKGMSYVLEKLKLSDKKGRIEVFGSTDSLQGKKVRITHRDGAVRKIEPVGCDLTEAERNLCANLGVLADYHVMPKLDVAVGEKWNVRADQFSNMLDPSMRGVPSGMLEITRRQTGRGASREEGEQVAVLEITAGSIQLDSSDTKTTRLGRCLPRGRLLYDLDGGFVKKSTLTAEIDIDRLSKKHLLFETRFKSTPSLEIDYECSKGTEQVLRVPDEWKDLKVDPKMIPKNLVP